MIKKRLVIFDKDGTLADTSQGILECHRYANVQMGRPEPTDAELSGIIGGHLLDIYKSRFRYSDSDAVKAVKLYREHYAECGINNVLLYEGMEATLRNLKEKGYLAELEGFHAGFILLAESLKKQYIDVPIYVSYYKKSEKTYIIDKPVMIKTKYGNAHPIINVSEIILINFSLSSANNRTANNTTRKVNVIGFGKSTSFEFGKDAELG